MMSHSGHAPLVKAVPPLLEHLDGIFGPCSAGRIVVIDAEANSVPFLKGLETGTPSRAWVTRLKESWVEGKRIFNRTNFRPYRNGDRVRMGVADFNDPDSPEGRQFRMRVAEVERRTTRKVTYLGASTKLDIRDWKPADVADLYFDRWPAQEANFRAVNQAVGAKDVHGYGKQLVDNVSVVTELDELPKKAAALREQAETQAAEVMTTERLLRDAHKLHRRRERRRETVGRRVAKRMAKGKRLTESLRNMTQETLRLDKDLAKGEVALKRLRRKSESCQRRLARTRVALQANADRQAEIEGQRHIFAHDVELDSLLSLCKVGLVLLVIFVLKEYLAAARMAVDTFLDRVANLPGELRATPDLEILTLDYNERDPEVMGFLASHLDAINAKRLTLRSGKVLRLQIAKPPPRPPGRPPPPPNTRTGTGDRFVR
jgi:hypothetical protein